MLLKGKKILLGVGGSIAAFKVPELIRALQKNGADVQVMMSRSARQFVTPLTLEALSGNPILERMFTGGARMEHIHVSREHDLVLIAPATANMLATFSYGMANTLISSTVLAAQCPVLLAPAMNSRMWENFLVQENYERLQKAGYQFVLPQSGDLACGEVGIGRLADISFIVESVKKVLTPQDLKGKKVVITAGGTREYLDPIRFMSNHSSGKMALCLAKEAYFRGANVILISTIPYPSCGPTMKVVSVTTTEEMAQATMKYALKSDIFIGAAAVADYRFGTFSEKKIKNSLKKFTVELEKNRDIIAEVGYAKGNTKKPFLVGFALETHKHLENAKKKFLVKRLNMVVVNGVEALGEDESQVQIITTVRKKMVVHRYPKMPKLNISSRIFDLIVKAL